MAEVIGRKVRLYGRVQGVFFRQWAVKQARSQGGNRWVHTAHDGSVEAHLAADENAVARMIEEMRRGPQQAHVEDLTIEEVEPEAVEGFSVRL